MSNRNVLCAAAVVCALFAGCSLASFEVRNRTSNVRGLTGTPVEMVYAASESNRTSVLTEACVEGNPYACYGVTGLGVDPVGLYGLPYVYQPVSNGSQPVTGNAQSSAGVSPEDLKRVEDKADVSIKILKQLKKEREANKE